MKTILGAIALTLAVPAFAQAAPAGDPHAQHQPGKHDCKECCEKMMKQHGGKMDCMDHKDGAKTAPADGQQDHQGHKGHAH